MPELGKKGIKQALENYRGRFSPKYRDFNILRNNIEVVVNQSTLIWKSIYGLTTMIVEVGKEKSPKKPIEVTIEET